MSVTCTAEDLVVALRAVSAAVVDHGDELTELDRAIGDADHGENMRRGFLAVAAKVDSPGQTTPAAVLKAVGTTLISTVGGASGPLYGTAFLRAATSLADVSEVDGVAVAAALRAALGGVVARGRAEVGDKTMVDALAPAADAAATAAEGGGDVPAVLAAAAEAAERGAESTKPLVARKGRASYLGERSAGHLDPGARSTALVLRALATAAGAR